MTGADQAELAGYELPLPAAPKGRQQGGKARAGGAGKSLTEPLLVANATWFCRLRWVIIAILTSFGALGALGAVGSIGLRPPGTWPFVAAGVLALGNICFRSNIRAVRRAGRPGRLLVNLWVQIIFDLAVLTAVVHFMGSIETFVAFAYLFHIVLACIFFSRAQSLAVTLTASVLYAACVALEGLGALEPATVFTDTDLRNRIMVSPEMLILNCLSAIGIWLVVWYLASYLSGKVCARESELAQTNRRLVAAQAERARHMLTTTHQLKSPFSAIDANAQILLAGHCGALPRKAAEVVRRISARSRRLAAEIQEMLQLANLESAGQAPPALEELDLSNLLRSCMGQLEPEAQRRGIAFDAGLQPAPLMGVEDHLKMLLGNLLSNAVTYSHDGGHVRVRCGAGTGPESVVTIADDGIGIAPDKLPHIFDEHYRTKEAVRHNKESSGLGLAIVRHVAELHGIRLRVASRPGAGTTFELRFPRAGNVPGEPAMKE